MQKGTAPENPMIEPEGGVRGGPDGDWAPKPGRATSEPRHVRVYRRPIVTRASGSDPRG